MRAIDRTQVVQPTVISRAYRGDEMAPDASPNGSEDHVIAELGAFHKSTASVDMEIVDGLVKRGLPEDLRLPVFAALRRCGAEIVHHGKTMIVAEATKQASGIRGASPR